MEKRHSPFPATCVTERETSPLHKGDEVGIQGMASEDECQHGMLVKMRLARTVSRQFFLRRGEETVG